MKQFRDVNKMRKLDVCTEEWRRLCALFIKRNANVSRGVNSVRESRSP